MKHLTIFKTISALILFAGMILFSLNNPTDIQAKSFTTVPKVLWGTWETPSKHNEQQLLKIAKYSFYVTGYKNGKKESGSWKVSGKKFVPNPYGSNDTELVVSKHANRYGYWDIGANNSDAVWLLKPVIHNGHRALKSAGPNIGCVSPKYLIDYYYKQ